MAVTQAGIDERGSCGAHVGGVRSFPPFSAVSVAAHVAHTRARGRRGCGQPCSAKSPTRKVRVRRSSCVAGDHVISRTCVYVYACVRVCVRACVRVRVNLSLRAEELRTHKRELAHTQRDLVRERQELERQEQKLVRPFARGAGGDVRCVRC